MRRKFSGLSHKRSTTVWPVAKSYFNIWSFATIKMFPIGLPKQVQNFPEYQINLPNITQDFLIFAKGAKSGHTDYDSR